MRAALLLAIASCVLVVGCSSGDTREPAASSSSTGTSPTETSATPSAAPSDPCDLLPNREVEQVAGGAVGAARSGMTGGLTNCQWAIADGGFVQVIGSTSSTWAQSLPDALRALESSGQFTDSANLRKIRAGAELVEAGQELDPVEACSLFSEMLELQGQPAGSRWIVNVVPDRENAMAVTGQQCTEGRFTSVMIADETGLGEPLPIAPVSEALRSAHRRNLGAS
ncbi:DUF3558 family protein [Nocardioides sp.]|uniref:DUF3558 family protein n=1 Tax=Nocardioides sp. TaxID=35761 RepID=UPI002D7EE17D|nr:DUF3558 family protein [Nocardioides sp.]HET8961986.1 DUF3558 family protein [Nocardioides sp.]